MRLILDRSVDLPVLAVDSVSLSCSCSVVLIFFSDDGSVISVCGFSEIPSIQFFLSVEVVSD
jgi:hypothetical protein